MYSISQDLFCFISRYAKNLPLRVKVCKGYYGECDSTAVTTGDLLNLHFVKNTKVFFLHPLFWSHIICDTILLRMYLVDTCQYIDKHCGRV